MNEMAIDIEEEKEPQDKMKYAYLVEEANKKWEVMGPEAQKLWFDMEYKNLGMFLMLWNCVKRIEREFNINAMGVVKDEWLKQLRQRGQEAAVQGPHRHRQGHGLRLGLHTCGTLRQRVPRNVRRRNNTTVSI